MKKKRASLQDSATGYIREISVAVFLQIQTDMLQVKFDFRLLFDLPKLILNFLCFLALIHE